MLSIEDINKLEAEKERYKKALKKLRNNLKEICNRECDFHWCRGNCKDDDCDYYKNIMEINEVLK